MGLAKTVLRDARMLARVLSQILAICLCALTVTLTPSALHAQDLSGVTEIPDPQVNLRQIRIISQSPTGVVLEISFYPRMPVYRVLRELNERLAGRTKFEIMFENARQVTTSSELPLRGLVELVEISTDETRDLTIGFTTSDPSLISAAQVRKDAIHVTLERVPQRDSSSFGDFGERAARRADDGDGEFDSFEPRDDFDRQSEEFELIMLKYADVSEVVGLLTEGITVRPNNTLIRRQPGFGSIGQGSGNNSGDADDPNENQPLGESVDRNLAINRRLNAIWVRGTRAEIERVRAQIDAIDVPVDSVILETEFVELTETGSRNLGLEIGNITSGQVITGSLRRGESVALELDPNQIQESFSLQAALYAQIQKGEGRIISKPRISAQSGATAKIITGDSLPILTSITLAGVDAVSEQVNYVNVGVTLQIAPRVSPDGFVTSKIFTVVSSVTGFSQGFPTISQREAETSASVRDGQSFVIGGLIQETDLTSVSKIPLLGDIPFLGELFKREASNSSKTELYIIITPHIVRHGEQIEVSQTVNRSR